MNVSCWDKDFSVGLLSILWSGIIGSYGVKLINRADEISWIIVGVTSSQFGYATIAIELKKPVEN